MAPAVASLPPSPRSASASASPSLSGWAPSDRISPRRAVPRRLSSSTSFDIPSFNHDFDLDISLCPGSRPAPVQTAGTPRDELAVPPSPPSLSRSRTTSFAERPRSWLKWAKAAPDEKSALPPSMSASVSVAQGAERSSRFSLTALSDRSLAVPDTISSFAKRRLRPSPRWPSPGRADLAAQNQAAAEGGLQSIMHKKRLLRRRSQPQPDLVDSSALDKPNSSQLSLEPPARPPLAKANVYLSKLKRRQPRHQPLDPGKQHPTAESNESYASSATSTAPQGSRSDEPRASQSTPSESTTSVHCLPSDSAATVRDPLWTSFHALDVEFDGFLLKNTGQRVIQIQSVVLPFLRATMRHESARTLGPEDVERRANVLNKWWTVALDMLDMPVLSGQQPIAASERPVLLEAAIVLMMRPEWRQLTKSFRPLVARTSPEDGQPRSRADSAASSASSDQAIFLAESAEHNVRTMFASNLIKQVALAVDRMSVRHVPLSLVNFSGKTCAYAFFFAPAVAEVLVRLWSPLPDLIRRAADSFGLPRTARRDGRERAAQFPACLSGLAWTCPRDTWAHLKEVPVLPMTLTRIPWTGSWISRWKGSDSDLFFIFYKYFHVLLDEFTPSGLSLSAKAESPGFVLVQAHLLAIFDSTIHRQAALDCALGLPSPVDAGHGADASALTMPAVPTNLMKGMAENRLVALLNHFLGDDTGEFAGARRTFAETFATMMKAAASRTSQYNHVACYTLCELLEECLLVYDKVEAFEGSAAYTDWPFWIEVWKRMLSSPSTLSEIQVFCTLFALWDTLTRDAQRRRNICLNWLLEEEVFETFFTHWCPMVRAYYHRLLCWRICRQKHSHDAVDRLIFQTVAMRLRQVWAHYLYLKQNAEDSRKMPPPAEPMMPLPGKKFVIVRYDVLPPQRRLFLEFDGFARLPRAEESADLGLGMLGLAAPKPKGDTKKALSLLGKMLSFTGGNSPGQATSKGYDGDMTWDDGIDGPEGDTAGVRLRTPMASPATKVASEGTADSRSTSPQHEERRHVFRFFLGCHQAPLPPPDRMLITRPPRLPGSARALASLRTNGCLSPLPSEASAAAATPPHSAPSGPTDGAADRCPTDASSAAARKGESAQATRSSTTETGDDCPGVPAAGLSDETQGGPGEPRRNTLGEPVTHPARPTGISAKNGVYTGRALAEWNQVVLECESFIDRRRDEGVADISDTEVPLLGVEGFRKLGA